MLVKMFALQKANQLSYEQTIPENNLLLIRIGLSWLETVFTNVYFKHWKNALENVTFYHFQVSP